MGYTKTIHFSGVTIPDVYHRVDVTSSADGVCTASVNTYASREAFLEGKGYLTQAEFTFNLVYGSGVGADKNQAYDYLLSLEENEGAIPVFEEDQPD